MLATEGRSRSVRGRELRLQAWAGPRRGWEQRSPCANLDLRWAVASAVVPAASVWARAMQALCCIIPYKAAASHDPCSNARQRT